jgi:hypothetical protein
LEAKRPEHETEHTLPFFGRLERTEISLKYNQQDATLSQFIYFYKFLYMFQAVSPPIIRSTKLCIRGTVSGIVKPILLPAAIVHDSSRQQYWFDNT